MRSFLILISLFIVTSVNAQKDITLEDIWTNYAFYAKSVPGFNFMKDGKHYTRLEENTIKVYDLTTGNFVEDLLSGESIKGQEGFNGDINSYRFSDDESKIMIKSETESIYRRSTKAFFHVYDRKSKKIQSIYNDDKISYASFNPAATKVAYVWENDLYYMDLKSGVTLPITTDGSKNKIINGATDWVYEEEFAFAKAFEWSPDGESIAFIRFDETEVKEFTMTWYNDGMYPIYDTFKYPKVGEDNAVVSAHIYNLKSDKTVHVSLGNMDDQYIPRIKWTTKSDELCVFKMNRHQNFLQLFLAEAETGETRVMYEEKNKYYIDITDDLTFLKNGREFVITSEKNGYNHVYVFDKNGKEKRQLTSGEYDVTSFYGVDEKKSKVYYQAAAKSPLSREVYEVSLKGGKPKEMIGKAGTNRAQFSSTFDYLVYNNSSANAPANYTVYNRDGRSLRVIENNEDLSFKLKEYDVSDVEFMTVPSDAGGELNASIIKPKNMVKGQKYPVLMYVYGGPGSQTVNNSWGGNNYWWYQMLAQKGYIVVSVDNRGTGARGEKFKKMTYMQLGHYETLDQIAAAKHLQTLDFVDSERIGIWGWSYGGYMSSNCILKGSDVFKAAIAVAPVTNWKWYDTIYTERYMRTNGENPDGYKENSPVYFADQLEGAYLLVHGMADDNVHFQHAVEMANALIGANKQFDTYFYPNRSHGIYGNNARIHLYTKMTNFILENL